MLFNRKLKSSSPCLLFYDFKDVAAVSNDDCSGSRRVARSPFSWLRSTARELTLPKIRRKLQSLIARIKRCQIQGHVTASEFGYDPMTYALNFEGDYGQESDKESPARNFVVRLPVSPDQLLLTKLPREVVT